MARVARRREKRGMGMKRRGDADVGKAAGGGRWPRTGRTERKERGG